MVLNLRDAYKAVEASHRSDEHTQKRRKIRRVSHEYLEFSVALDTLAISSSTFILLAKPTTLTYKMLGP